MCTLYNNTFQKAVHVPVSQIRKIVAVLPTGGAVGLGGVHFIIHDGRGLDKVIHGELFVAQFQDLVGVCGGGELVCDGGDQVNHDARFFVRAPMALTVKPPPVQQGLPPVLFVFGQVVDGDFLPNLNVKQGNHQDDIVFADEIKVRNGLAGMIHKGKVDKYPLVVGIVLKFCKIGICIDNGPAGSGLQFLQP